MREETYCLSCRKCTKNINPKMIKNKNNRSIIQTYFAMCDSKKSRFIKEQLAKDY